MNSDSWRWLSRWVQMQHATRRGDPRRTEKRVRPDMTITSASWWSFARAELTERMEKATGALTEHTAVFFQTKIKLVFLVSGKSIMAGYQRVLSWHSRVSWCGWCMHLRIEAVVIVFRYAECCISLPKIGYHSCCRNKESCSWKIPVCAWKMIYEYI